MGTSASGLSSALFLCVPGFICRGLMFFSQLNVSNILQSGRRLAAQWMPTSPKRKWGLIAQYINQQRWNRRGVNNLLAVLYLLVKLFYFFNIFGPTIFDREVLGYQCQYFRWKCFEEFVWRQTMATNVWQLTAHDTLRFSRRQFGKHCKVHRNHRHCFSVVSKCIFCLPDIR